MPVGYRNSAGVDFDDLFDPDVQGDGPTASFLRTAAGVPLRYADISYGSKGPNVGYRTSAGVDVSNLWAARGTAQYAIPGLQGKALSASGVAPTGGVTAAASVIVSLLNNGTWLVSGSNNFGSVPQPDPTTGVWTAPGLTPADYDFRLRVSSSGDATATNTAASWRRASTGGAASASIGVSVPGGSADLRRAQMSVSVDLRNRATGAVSTTTLSGSVTATGFS